MRHVSSSEFKNQFGEYLAMSRDEPIAIQKSGKPVAIVLSPVEYEHLQRLDDLYWIARAEAAEAAGELEEIDRGIAEADAGDFATDDEVEAAFRDFGA